jgi:transposase
MKEPEQLAFAAYIGLDWADRKHVIRLCCAGRDEVEHHELTHTPEAMAEWVASLRQRFGGRPVAVILEQSRGSVIHALMGYDFLVLYPVNPKTLAKYREAFRVSGAKDDPDDAQSLLEILMWHRERLRPWHPDDELTRTITLLVEHRRTLVNDQTRLTNRLTSALKSYFPQALAWAGQLKTLQACDFLDQWSTLKAVQEATDAELYGFYLSHGTRQTKLIEQRLEQIKVAQPLTSDQAVINGSAPMVLALAAQLRAVLVAIDEMGKQIEVLFAEHPDEKLWDSFPGAGPVLRPRLMAAMGADRERYADAREVQQFSGIAPVTERSGKSCWVHWRLACPKFVRQSFHEYAAQSIRFSPWAKAFYEQQRQRGKGHHAAVRSLAYRWIRIMFRCWQQRTTYDEAQYHQALSRRQSPLTKLLAAPVVD